MNEFGFSAEMEEDAKKKLLPVDAAANANGPDTPALEAPKKSKSSKKKD